ncbi:hypothetical protein HY025_01175 [Candidatus Daviesbacteria bacterium]|nr:hypothetical protein [Candidatus Daviesbacteria bacterium]
MKNPMLMTIVVAIVVGAAAFFGGMQYQKMQPGANGTTGQFRQGGGSRLGGQGRFAGNRPVAGQIISVDDKSITVKLMDGSTKIVLLSGNTQINKAQTAQISDLTTGEMVAVFGTANSDGSVTAQNIQLNPMFGRFGGSASPSAAAQ